MQLEYGGKLTQPVAKMLRTYGLAAHCDLRRVLCLNFTALQSQQIARAYCHYLLRSSMRVVYYRFLLVYFTFITHRCWM